MIAIISLYILGLLQRHGPLHGYQLKKIIAERLSDFTQIKLPTIYYHLEKMCADGLLAASSEKPGSRPEKTVYALTDKGTEAFGKKLRGMLEFDYQPVFSSDSVFFFSDKVPDGEIAAHLKVYVQKLENVLKTIHRHKVETLQFIPEGMSRNAAAIFSHHEYHYKAELQWAAETLSIFEEVR